MLKLRTLLLQNGVLIGEIEGSRFRACRLQLFCCVWCSDYWHMMPAHLETELPKQCTMYMRRDRRGARGAKFWKGAQTGVHAHRQAECVNGHRCRHVQTRLRVQTHRQRDCHFVRLAQRCEAACRHVVKLSDLRKRANARRCRETRRCVVDMRKRAGSRGKTRSRSQR